MLCDSPLFLAHWKLVCELSIFQVFVDDELPFEDLLLAGPTLRSSTTSPQLVLPSSDCCPLDRDDADSFLLGGICLKKIIKISHVSVVRSLY